MRTVLLLNQEQILHYRIPIYNYMSHYLATRAFALSVVSRGIQNGNPHEVRFHHVLSSLTFLSLARTIWSLKPDVVIFWVNLKHLYLFPTIILAKMLRSKVIYWGHGCDLCDKGTRVKNFAYRLQHWMSDAIVLYAEHLKQNIYQSFHRKCFVANNTLYLTDPPPNSTGHQETLQQYGIITRKNIICMGRLEKRKRIHDLVEAFKLLSNPDLGLILVGPDIDGILADMQGPNVYKLGPLYGKQSLALLSAATVYCLPGHVGLGIVDAFHCGLPIVTEDCEHAPEIMYFKEGVNGFMVPVGDVQTLAARLKLLVEDESLREKFASAARKEIMTNGHISTMCEGFAQALEFVVA